MKYWYIGASRERLSETPVLNDAELDLSLWFENCRGILQAIIRNRDKLYVQSLIEDTEKRRTALRRQIGLTEIEHFELHPAGEPYQPPILSDIAISDSGASDVYQSVWYLSSKLRVAASLYKACDTKLSRLVCFFRRPRGYDRNEAVKLRDNINEAAKYLKSLIDDDLVTIGFSDAGLALNRCGEDFRKFVVEPLETIHRAKKGGPGSSGLYWHEKCPDMSKATRSIGSEVKIVLEEAGKLRDKFLTAMNKELDTLVREAAVEQSLKVEDFYDGAVLVIRRFREELDQVTYVNRPSPEKSTLYARSKAWLQNL